MSCSSVTLHVCPAAASRCELSPLSSQGSARFRTLVRTHVDFTARSLRNLGVPDGEVEDAVQQVFLIASQKLADIAAHAEKAFLFQTALRIASRARRTQSRRREGGDTLLPLMVDPAPLPDEALERQRKRELLDQVLQQMPFDLRTVFVFFEIEEVSCIEVAEILMIPVGTVKSRLRRARQEFEERVHRLHRRRQRTASGER